MRDSCEILVLATESEASSERDGAEAAVGWRRLRWHVRIATDASEAQVLRVLEHAERASTCLRNVDSSCRRVRTYEVLRPAT